MIGLLNYLARQPGAMPGMPPQPQQPMGLLNTMSNQGKLVQPPQPFQMGNDAAAALQGAQQNSIVMPAKKKDDSAGGGAGGLMTLFKLFLGG